MIKDIKYSGYTAVPSDYESPDGDLAYSLNLINETGSITPIKQPEVVGQLTGDGGESDRTVIYIHSTSYYDHYIFYDQTSRQITWSNGGTVGASKLIDGVFANVSHCNAIGNTLLIFTSLAIHYIYWDGSQYINLGDHIPNISISFGLIGRPRLFSISDESHNKFEITHDTIPDKSSLSNDNKRKITEQVMAKVNKFVADQTVNKGRFCFPFLVRYALRLYDGSLINHSTPILMCPSTSAVPIVWWEVMTNGTKSTCDIMLVAATLDYQIISDSELSALEKWGDIITGIDIFISKPIYTYDQSGEIQSLVDKDKYSTKFIGRLYAENKTYNTYNPTEDHVVGSFASKDFLDVYAEWEYSKIYCLYYNTARTYTDSCIRLPEFSEGKVRETISNTSLFYKLHSISFDKIKASATRNEIIVDDEYLQSLTAREVMTDDYMTHERLIADDSYVYNNRLNLSGVKHVPFNGFSAATQFAHLTHFAGWNKTANTLNIPLASIDRYITINVYIKENGKNFAVTSSTNAAAFNSIDLYDGNQTSASFPWRRSNGCYLFYPNTAAFKMVITDGYHKYMVDLKPHDMLNGSFALLDFDVARENNTGQPPTTDFGAATYSMGLPIYNKVYTSEVNNPFYFPVTGINTIGTGNILGMATAAKALSEGQFGQFPLYAFTDEGVWAMEVSATGTYSAKQPITRDVCINPEGITQIDSAVLFPTDRGIMLISGSNVTCISEPINSDTPFDILSLPQMNRLHAMLGHDADTCLPLLPFSEFLKECRMIYDYNHQRIIVYNAQVSYAYVYSLKTQLWGMMHANFNHNINSYPEALAVTSDGALVNFARTSDVPVPGLLVTRPMKLDGVDILKTIDTIIQRGNFSKGHVQSVLYGSRDLINWSLVWSSKDHFMRGFRGTPYKYFRIALLCNLDDGESIAGATVSHSPRHTNRLR